MLLLVAAGCHRPQVTSTETAGDSGTEAPSPKQKAEISTGERAAQLGLTPETVAEYEAWFRKYGLKFDAATLAADTDGDGYSNREEFLAGTNPLDPNSMPGMVDGVSMKELKDVRVPIILRAVKDGKAQVERTDKPGREELREGSQPAGLPYRVTSIKQEVKADKHGVFTDVSQLTMENPGTKEIVVLVRDMPARSSETHAIIAGTDGVEQKIHVDEVISLPGMKGRQFKVLELRPDQVVVEEIGTKRPLTIPKR